MKKLITEKAINEFANTGEKVFPIDKNTLITPSAKDLARNEGITFRFEGEQQNNDIGCSEAVCDGSCRVQANDVKIESETNVVNENGECNANITNGKSNPGTRDKIVEAVIKALKEKGVLDQIIDK